MRRRLSVATAAAVGVAAVLSACSTTPSVSNDAITVFAASSLKSVFGKLAGQFEKAHPGTRVNVSFAGSSDLVTQLVQGAPADVFASADEKNMDKAVDAGLVPGKPVIFATNT